MNIYIICMIILLVVILILLAKIMIIKMNVRNLKEELSKTRKENYNRQLRVSLMDKDVENLAAEINDNLEYQKSLKLETEKTRRQLEQSISDIAHDLRTPLTVIKGNLQMMKKEELSPKGREYLKISEKKASTLKTMVDEFFELSVLESDSNSVELGEVDLIPFLSEFIIENETLIRQNNLTPEISFPKRSVYVRADKGMLTRVFSNLFGNIFKYAKDSFGVTLDDVADAEFAIIRVSNKAENVEDIDIDHIFDRTYRADKARSEGGAGLGLYIARLLMEKQKGTITAFVEDSMLVFEVKIKKVTP